MLHKHISYKRELEASRRKLADLLGLAPCPAPSPGLFTSILAHAPQPLPVAVWRRPRFAMALATALLLAALSVQVWRSSEDNDALSDVDELAAASSFVL